MDQLKKQPNIVSSDDLNCNSITVSNTTPIDNDELTSKIYVDTRLSEKQAQITDQSDIECKDIVADNIILRPPDLFGDIDITKGSISCTTITTGTVSALYKYQHQLQ